MCSRVKLEVWKNSVWLRTDASPVSSGGAVMLVEAASARRALNTLGTRKLLGPGSVVKKCCGGDYKSFQNQDTETKDQRYDCAKGRRRTRPEETA